MPRAMASCRICAENTWETSWFHEAPRVLICVLMELGMKTEHDH
jgi:hypothetical protein